MTRIDEPRLPLIAGGIQLPPLLPIDRVVVWPFRPIAPPIRPVLVID